MKKISPGTWTSIAIIYSQGALGAAIVTQGPPILADIVRDFQVTASTASLFVSLSAAFPLVGLVLVGWIVDMVGGRKAMVASSLVIFAADLAMFFAPSITALYIARFVESIGRTVCMAGGIGLLAATTNGPRRVHAMAIGATFGPVGLAIGFALGSPFAGTPGWRDSFLLHAAWAFAQILAAAATIMPPAARVSLSEGAPKANPFSIYRMVGPWRLAIACFAEVFVQHGLSTILPAHYLQVHSLTSGRTATYQAAAQLANIPGSLLGGVLLARGMSRLALALSMGGVGVCSAIVLLASGVPLPLAIFALFLMNITFGGLISLLFNLVTSVSPDQRSYNATAGLLQQMAAVGGITGPFVFVVLLTQGNWALCAAAATCGLILLSTIMPVWTSRTSTRKSY